MVKTEKIKINDTEYIRNYSNANLLIERDGVKYSEAIDPVDTNRKYVETDEPIVEPTESDYAEAGKILLGVTE